MKCIRNNAIGITLTILIVTSIACLVVALYNRQTDYVKIYYSLENDYQNQSRNEILSNSERLLNITLHDGKLPQEEIKIAACVIAYRNIIMVYASEGDFQSTREWLMKFADSYPVHSNDRAEMLKGANSVIQKMVRNTPSKCKAINESAALDTLVYIYEESDTE